jgi:hypothetical protein
LHKPHREHPEDEEMVPEGQREHERGATDVEGTTMFQDNLHNRTEKQKHKNQYQRPKTHLQAPRKK